MQNNLRCSREYKADFYGLRPCKKGGLLVANIGLTRDHVDLQLGFLNSFDRLRGVPVNVSRMNGAKVAGCRLVPRFAVEKLAHPNVIFNVGVALRQPYMITNQLYPLRRSACPWYPHADPRSQ